MWRLQKWNVQSSIWFKDCEGHVEKGKRFLQKMTIFCSPSKIPLSSFWKILDCKRIHKNRWIREFLSFVPGNDSWDLHWAMLFCRLMPSGFWCDEIWAFLALAMEIWRKGSWINHILSSNFQAILAKYSFAQEAFFKAVAVLWRGDFYFERKVPLWKEKL